jgi:hypothetical protein
MPSPSTKRLGEIIDEAEELIGPNYKCPQGFEGQHRPRDKLDCRAAVRGCIITSRRQTDFGLPTNAKRLVALDAFERAARVAKAKAEVLAEFQRRYKVAMGKGFAIPVWGDPHDPESDPCNDYVLIADKLDQWRTLTNDERRGYSTYTRRGSKQRDWRAGQAAEDAHRLLTSAGHQPTLTDKGIYVRLTCLLYEAFTGKYDCTSTVRKYCGETLRRERRGRVVDDSPLFW